MDKKDKRYIKKLLISYPALKAKIRNTVIADYPLTGVDYDKVNTQPTNDFYSRVEEYVCDDLDGELSEELERDLKRKHIIDNALDSLTEQEYDMVVDRFWERKTLEEMANGEYGTYNQNTIWYKLRDILKKLKEAGILKCKEFTIND